MNHPLSAITRLLVLLVLLLAGAVPASAASQPAPLKTGLVAVIPSDFPPTYFRDPATGQPSGLAVDVMNEVARRAGLTVSYRFAKPWQEIEELVLTGEADLIPFRVINEKTSREFLFSSPLDINYINYFAPSGDKECKGPNPGDKIGVIRGSTADDYLKNRTDLRLVQHDSLEHLLIDLLSGQVDLILTASTNLRQVANHLHLEDRIRIIEPAVLETRRGIALRRGDEQLQKRLNEAIAAFHNSAKSARIYEKWDGTPEPYWTAKRTAIALGSLLVVITGALLTWHISSLRRTNRRLKAEQTFLQTMIDAIPDFIFFKDRNSVYLGCNRAFAERMHGYTKEQLAGLTDFELQKDKKLASYFNQTDREVIESGQTIRFDTSFTLENGRQIQVDVIKTPFRDMEGQITGIIGISRDITERFYYQQQLEDERKRAEAANRAKSQFLANMSHELRTPLNGVLGMSELLAMSDLDQQQRQQLDLIQMSGNNLLAVLNDILDLAKVEANMLKLVSEEFSPGSLVEEVAAFFHHSCEQKGLALNVVLAPEMPDAVMGDPQRIRQVLFNLMGNAVKFTHQGQVMLDCSVATGPDQPCLEFKVCDTGIGISAADQKRIFNAFEQADNSNTREYGGTGLGLAICKRLTRLMGGNLTLESTLGQGSCFILTLPLKPAATSTRTLPTTTGNQTKASPPAGLTVLVAEDNDINRFFLVKILRQMGHQVLEANDGQQALDLMEQQGCDLALLDIQMPVMDGSQALQEIRKRDATRNRKTDIIALTAYAMNGDREKFIQQGFDDYLSKPLQPGDLEAAIERYLGRKTAA